MNKPETQKLEAMTQKLKSFSLSICDKSYDLTCLNKNCAHKIKSLSTSESALPSQITKTILKHFVNLQHLQLEVLGFDDFKPLDLSNFPKLISLKMNIYMNIYFNFGRGAEIEENFTI